MEIGLTTSPDLSASTMGAFLIAPSFQGHLPYMGTFPTWAPSFHEHLDDIS